MRLFVLPAALALFWLGCSSSRPSDENPFETRTVTLPGGAQVRAEVMIRPIDIARGYMYRDAVPVGTGMLFVHQKPETIPYYMYNVRVPLDMIFMDQNRRVVEIAAAVPPCKTRASECPTYGGHYPAQFVLELGGGQAARYGLKVGDTLTF